MREPVHASAQPNNHCEEDLMPTVIPMLSYEDGPAALDWLVQAFGFRERTRVLGDDGQLLHGEVETDYAGNPDRRL
jgi:hypothetical protein